jgi:hypothetical protein
MPSADHFAAVAADAGFGAVGDGAAFEPRGLCCISGTPTSLYPEGKYASLS